MSNQKQDGSNCINVEWSTGRCPTGCEQCFVNFGQQGQATCRGMVNPGSTAAATKKIEESLRQIAAVGKKTKLYTPPPRLPKGTKAGKGRELLLREIKGSAKGFFNIPTKGANDPWAVKARSAQRRMRQDVEGLDEELVFPFFLRASSMSDSSWAPPEWLRAVRDAWGNHCFFNSAIRSLASAKRAPHRRAVFDEYHKLVVTLNPGQQRVTPMRPTTSRPKSKAARTKEAAQWKRAHPWNAHGSMGKPVATPMDYFNATTLSEIGLQGLEDVIKFYRLRALPTIWPYVNGQRPDGDFDLPIVTTQMRFKGLDHALEFARRYKLESEVHVPAYRYENNKLPALIANKVNPFKRTTRIIKDHDVHAPRVYIRTKKGDKRNASPHAGDWSVYEFWSSFYRVVETERYDVFPYVCDRLHGGCKDCGLCASLDGTERDWTNPLNVMPWGDVWGPFPYREGSGYLGTLMGEWDEGDFFGGLLQDELGDAWDPQFDDDAARYYMMRKNPSDPAEVAKAQSILHAVAAYVNKETTKNVDFCEGWNTHEYASAATAFAIWSLMVHVKRRGMEAEKGFDWIVGKMTEATGGVDVLSGVDEVWEMWDGESEWNDQFGLVR